MRAAGSHLLSRVRPEDPDHVRQAVGRTVAALRRDRALTQGQLADQLGVTAQYVGLIERGTQNLTLATLTRLANTLGVGVRDLFPPRGTPLDRPRPGRPTKPPGAAKRARR